MTSDGSLSKCVIWVTHSLRGRNFFHAGFVKSGGRPGSAKLGDVCRKVMESGTGNYLANLVLYPGASQHGHVHCSMPLVFSIKCCCAWPLCYTCTKSPYCLGVFTRQHGELH